MSEEGPHDTQGQEVTNPLQGGQQAAVRGGAETSALGQTTAKLQRRTSNVKTKLSIIEALVSNVRKMTLAEEVREERREAIEAAAQLRAISMESVCGHLHPAKSYSKTLGIASCGGGFTRQPSMATMGTRVSLVDVAGKARKEEAVVVSEMPTFSLRDKIYFLFNGVPNALRRAQELQLWLLPSTLVVNLTLSIVTLSCVSFCLESLPENYYADPAPQSIQLISIISMVWLSFELLMRFFFCPDLVDLLLNPMTFVDIASNVPYYIEFASGARVARILILFRLLRLTRVLRVLELSKHNVGMQAVWGSIRQSVSGLTLFMLLLTVILFVGSSMIYIAEQTQETFDEANNMFVYDNGNKRSPFQSIVHSLWYVITTITTVGYGDDVVRTPLGKAISSFLMLIGPFVIAFPTVILSANFEEVHRELIETENLGNEDVSAEESKRTREKKTAEFANVMRQFVPKEMQEEMAKKNAMIHKYVGRADLSYTISVGAPPRNIVIRDGVALYDPLLMLRCAHPDGEPEYGFQSSTGVMVTVRDNYPTGAIVKFHLLLHTMYTQEAAILAVHSYSKSHSEVTINSVAPRPIRILRVAMKSKHVHLAHAHIVCNKFRDPFGTIPIEVVLTKTEALPVLLRYSSSCCFHFKVEYHDSTTAETSELIKFGNARVEYDGGDAAIAQTLRASFPNES